MKHIGYDSILVGHGIAGGLLDTLGIIEAGNQVSCLAMIEKGLVEGEDRTEEASGGAQVEPISLAEQQLLAKKGKTAFHKQEQP